MLNTIRGNPKSLEAILSSFHKVIEDLDNLMQRNTVASEAKTRRVEAIKAEINVLNAESEKAARVQEKLTALFT